MPPFRKFLKIWWTEAKSNNLLTYLDDDGISVEPIYYQPIIPMILVNGSKGIGTGFSTDIMCYNPIKIINYIEGILNKLDITQQKSIVIEPYYMIHSNHYW